MAKKPEEGEQSLVQRLQELRGPAPDECEESIADRGRELMAPYKPGILSRAYELLRTAVKSLFGNGHSKESYDIICVPPEVKKILEDYIADVENQAAAEHISRLPEYLEANRSYCIEQLRRQTAQRFKKGLISMLRREAGQAIKPMMEQTASKMKTMVENYIKENQGYLAEQLRKQTESKLNKGLRTRMLKCVEEAVVTALEQTAPQREKMAAEYKAAYIEKTIKKIISDTQERYKIKD